VGLISHVGASGALGSTLDGILDTLLAKPADALRATQRLLRHGERDELLKRMRLEGAAFSERLASAEVKEAIAAFFEKRKPDYSRSD
jgi:enoyl-CoA hydratase/carnithine racemase